MAEDQAATGGSQGTLGGLMDDYVAALVLVSNAIGSGRKTLPKISLATDTGLRQTATVQRYGGSTKSSERKAIVTVNKEHFPGAINYPAWEQRARIERIEALCCAILAAWDWIEHGRNNIAAGKSVGTMDMIHAAHRIGCCDDPNIQRTSERMRCAGYYRSTLGDDGEGPDVFSLDTYEDRAMCMLCHYPIGSWEPARFAQAGIHEACTVYLKLNNVRIIPGDPHAPHAPLDSNSAKR